MKKQGLRMFAAFVALCTFEANTSALKISNTQSHVPGMGAFITTEQAKTLRIQCNTFLNSFLKEGYHHYQLTFKAQKNTTNDCYELTEYKGFEPAASEKSKSKKKNPAWEPNTFSRMIDRTTDDSKREKAYLLAWDKDSFAIIKTRGTTAVDSINGLDFLVISGKPIVEASDLTSTAEFFGHLRLGFHVASMLGITNFEYMTNCYKYQGSTTHHLHHHFKNCTFAQQLLKPLSEIIPFGSLPIIFDQTQGEIVAQEGASLASFQIPFAPMTTPPSNNVTTPHLLRDSLNPKESTKTSDAARFPYWDKITLLCTVGGTLSTLSLIKRQQLFTRAGVVPALFFAASAWSYHKAKK